MAVFSGIILVAQFIFNTFFAGSLYLEYKKGTMEEVFRSIEESYDGTKESLQNATTQYQQVHNMDIFITKDETLIYSSFERFFEDDTMPSIPPERMGEEDFIGGNHAYVRDQFQGDKKAAQVLELDSVFMYEGEEIRVLMQLPVSSIEDSVSVLTNAGIVITSIVLFLGFGVAILISRSLTKPILEIEQVSYQMAHLNFEHKVEERGGSIELVNLAKSINSLSDQLESSIGELNQVNAQLHKDIELKDQLEIMRREFVGSVSHEMKTPLAILQMYAEMLKSDTTGIDKDYYLDTIVEETTKLSELVSSMLDISSIESGISKMTMEHCNLSELCEKTLERIQGIYQKQELLVEKEENLYTFGDKKYLEQAIKNYLTNAMEHVRGDGIVKVRLVSEKGKLQFSVYNEGETIADEDLPHIWESFYRGDKSRTGSGKNVGLGLHIVKTIIKKHGGDYGCRNLDRGVEFYFTLNVKKM